MDVFTDYDYSAHEFDAAKTVYCILSQKLFENIYEGSESYVEMRFSGLDYMISLMRSYHCLIAERQTKRLDFIACTNSVRKGLKLSFALIFLVSIFLLAVPAAALTAPVVSFVAIVVVFIIIAPRLRFARAARSLAAHSEVHVTETQALRKEMSFCYDELTDFADTISAQKRDIMTTPQVIGLYAIVFISFAPGLLAYLGIRRLRRKTLILPSED